MNTAAALTDEVEYKCSRYTLDGRVTRTVTHRGRQVGRLAVRRAGAGSRAVNRHGETFATDGCYVVDHIPSGVGLVALTSIDDAMRLADDVSRFASVDLDATTEAGLVTQLGDRMLRWFDACGDADSVVPYREWLAQQENGL